MVLNWLMPMLPVVAAVPFTVSDPLPTMETLADPALSEVIESLPSFKPSNRLASVGPVAVLPLTTQPSPWAAVLNVIVVAPVS